MAPLLEEANHSLPAADAGSQYFSWAAGGSQQIDAVLVNFLEFDSREQDFWRTFEARLRSGLATEFSDEIVIRIRAKRAVAPQLQSNVQAYGQWAYRSLEASGSLPVLHLSGAPDFSRSEAKRPIARFPTVEGLRWDEVTMVFVSNDSVRVSARDVTKTYTFAEAGFKDGRKGDRPDTRWAFLQRLAKHGGNLDWNANWDRKVRGRLKAAISNLRKRLQDLMGIEDDPFHRCREMKAYRTKFQLRNKAYSTPEAEPEDEE